MLRATNKKYFWDLTYISIFWGPENHKHLPNLYQSEGELQKIIKENKENQSVNINNSTLKKLQNYNSFTLLDVINKFYCICHMSISIIIQSYDHIEGDITYGYN
ncbi:hypothetical protein RhiirC2_798300 [Rhizophagus irregularis]|uniref:Uncharacterized protein n=1 Tax=Rhizophagus irregularis TaxID=588596 RepID=A0A2N1M6M3_9GLOM|nr:hypothetical protein RhiirC2_798300 [Rhizophagus irregularis]